MNGTSCKPGTHQIDLPTDPDIRTARCKVCSALIGLYSGTCFCGAIAAFYSMYCPDHTNR
jgi:hypothetical protein